MSDIAISRRSVLSTAVSAALISTLIPESFASERVAPKGGTPALISSGGKTRFLHTATALQDGRILMAGGYHVNEAMRLQKSVLPSTSVEIYDPSSDSWSQAAPLKSARARHASVLLPDGRVAVLGGYLTNVLDSVEIYDPSTNTWTDGEQLPRPMADHAACVSGAKVVMSGGKLGTSALIHAIAATRSQPIP